MLNITTAQTNNSFFETSPDRASRPFSRGGPHLPPPGGPGGGFGWSSNWNILPFLRPKVNPKLYELGLKFVQAVATYFQGKSLDFPFSKRASTFSESSIDFKKMALQQSLFQRFDQVIQVCPAFARHDLPDQAELNQNLLKAAQEANLENLKAAIEAGANINAQNQDGNTALHLVVAQKHFHRDLMDALLQNPKTNLNLKNNKGQTPLLVASGRDFGRLLQEPSVDVNAQDQDGNTALHSLYQGPNLDLGRMAVVHRISQIRELLDHGADPHIRNNNGEDLPYLIFNRGKILELEILIDSGRIFNLYNLYPNGKFGAQYLSEQSEEYALTPLCEKERELHFSAAKGDVKALEVYKTPYRGLPYSNLGRADKLDFTPLHVAAMNGQTDFIRELLKLKSETIFVELDPTIHEVITPLHLAAMMGHLSSVEALLDAGANPQGLEDSNIDRQPLTCAILCNQLEVVKLLLIKTKHAYGIALEYLKHTLQAGNWPLFWHIAAYMENRDLINAPDLVFKMKRIDPHVIETMKQNPFHALRMLHNLDIKDQTASDFILGLQNYAYTLYKSEKDREKNPLDLLDLPEEVRALLKDKLKEITSYQKQQQIQKFARRFPFPNSRSPTRPGNRLLRKSKR